MSDAVQVRHVATKTLCQARTPTGICHSGPHATNSGQCLKGHALPGNQLRRTHGAYSFRDRGDAAIPEDLRISADAMVAGIIADKGGAENCPTLMREYIQQTRNLRVVMDLFGNEIVANGLFTKEKRVRSVFSKWLETLDRFDRFATKIGLNREARQMPSLSAYLAQASDEQNHVTSLRANLAAAEHELDRAETLGDTGAVARVRVTLEPRIAQLRRAINDAERSEVTTTERNL